MALAEPSSVSPESLEKGYEQKDASPGGLGLFVVFFIITAIVLHVALWVLLKYYVALPREADAPQSVVAAEPPVQGPYLQPSPQHNFAPSTDLERMKAGHRELFRGMGWRIDEKTGEPIVPREIVQQLQGSRKGGSP